MAHAGEVARGDLAIVGLGLEVQREPVITAVDVPSYVQTLFGGATAGLSAQGELTGPGIQTPITLSAVPGQKFAIPALHEKGDYALQNIRLVGAGGEFLQQAVPSMAVIQVTDVLKTNVKVRQLTPQELRDRGIYIDDRNYEVYEYTFIFGVGDQKVEIPYPVIIDKRTREITPLPRAGFAMLPIPTKDKPPRFSPPQIETFDLSYGGPGPEGDQKDKEPKPGAPTLPAALVVPNGFGVLHQFFAVILQVSNAAPDGSNIRLDSITAKLSSPLTMRVSKTMPAVSLGQPVPVVDETTGATFLVAGAQGSAEWTLEALKAGTHTLDIDVRATYQKPGQEDFGLSGRVSTSLVVSDPRFHVNFSHPDVVRKDDKYTAYSFITNLSAQSQHVDLDLSDIPACSSGGSANNVCRAEGSDHVELDLAPGAMVPVAHKLIARVTGKVYAAAGAANDEAVGVSVHLTMGVSASGIPLSPATLVMPYYAQFLPTELVDAQMQLLGLGYSLATAPLTQLTASKPRVITTDVFRRAQQIALAGQRIFTVRHARDTGTAAENRDAFLHLSLDLLGNVERVDQLDGTPELSEWDELRRSEDAGRSGAAALARQLETIAPTPQQFVDDFAAATSHRTPFFFAYVHGPPVAGNARPYALSVQGLASQSAMNVPAEAAGGWQRGLPYGELTKFSAGGEDGELAMAGRWSEGLRISVVPASTSFTLHLLYPDTTDGTTLRTDVAVTNAQIGVPVTIDVQRGARVLLVKNATATPLVDVVPQTPLRILGAAQDLNLDGGGHVVGLLFNRPVTIADGVRLRDLLSLTINVAKASYSTTRRNNPADPAAELQIPAAALQTDGRIVLITFDKTLSKNADYSIGVENIGGLTASVVPRVDNDRPAAILTGKVLRGDNTPVPNVLVRLRMLNARVQSFDGGFPELIQYDVAGADGRFLFEYVPRDIDRGLFGEYDLLTETPDGKQATLTGSVRLPGEVHYANLVFLGTGKAQGQVRWDDGAPIPHINVTAGSPLFGGTFSASTGDDGRYEIDGLPVGPLVFSTVDPDGRMVYATNAIRTAGEVITQDLVAVRDTPAPGFATVRVQVLRSDTMAPVSGAQVGVGNEHVQLQTAYTDAQGRAEFRDVPAGLMSILAAEFSISRHGAAVEVDLHRDQVLEQTLVLQIADASVKYATLEGTVTRDDPAAPGDGTKDQVVPNAVINIYGVPPVTANADGTYVVPDLPLGITNHWVQVFDPQTSRQGWFRVPTLVEGANHFPMRLSTINSGGKATMRVRVTGGGGEPVAGAMVFAPGYPPEHYTNKGGGLYDLEDISVPMADEVYAVMADPTGPYGDQYVKGTARVDFDGQIGVTDLRLPGNGTVVAKIEMEQPCSTPPCYAQAIGPVAMTYFVWDDFQQKVMPKTVVVDPDPATNLVTFNKVPARQDVVFETVRHPGGYDRQTIYLGFDGDLRNVTLRLKTIGDVTGRVLAHDGITPVAGATVRINTGTAVYGAATTKQDGTFVFAGIPANIEFNVTAELNQDGVYRTGFVTARTPQGGGPVGNLVVVMREQATVEGRVVDNTNGAAVPLARYWLRELAWPYRSIGTSTEPLTADIQGRFVVSNVFTGAFRVTAVAPDNQEIRGDYQGTLTEEGDVSQRNIEVRIGGAGVGSVSVTVVDPVLGFEPVANAEVTLLRGGGRFDFTTTNDAGVAFFDQVPVGASYSVFAFSKQRGRSGSSSAFSVNTNQTTAASVQLDFLGVISGTLTDPDGQPANVPVPATPVSYSGPVGLRVTTDTDGKFEFNGVPEGPFTLQAWEIATQRIAEGPAGLFISKLVPEQRNIHLELERMGTLTVKVYLPDDAGGPGELAPLVEVTATQCTICNQITPDYPYFRSAQGNPVTFPRMFRRVGYGLQIRELGGEARTINAGGSFPSGALTYEQIVVLPQSGGLEVTVRDGSGQPVADAEVRVSGGKGFTVFTGADGKVSLTNLPFGWYTVQAKKNNVSAAAGGEVHSRSQPLQLILNLGTNIGVAGHVEAEEGSGLPSARTRVVLTANSSLLQGTLRLETFTDANGDYAFTGIPVGGTSLSLLFFGPDDTTIGARLAKSIPDGTTGTVALQSVKLDATPPRVLAIDPPANATNVSPSQPITITFSEEIKAQYLNRDVFELLATDDNSRVNSMVTGSIRPDRTYIVTITPPDPPAGQTFRLKSNVLYRLAISDSIEDATGNHLRTTVGSSFTTVNYTEPAIVRLDPAETEPVPEQATFRIKFNKPVDANAGAIALERLDAYKGSPIATIPITRFVDPVDPTTIVVAPSGVTIAESSFYRLSVSGVHDTQTPPNVQKDARAFELFSFDRKRPVVTIVSPVAAGEKLTAGVLYTAGVSIKNEGTSDDANDVAYVDWLDAGGVSVARVKTKPYGYDFVAPNTTSGTTFTLKATATDLSGNTSEQPAAFTWDVAPNVAPTQITVTNDVPSVYPTGRVESRVRFKDEGVAVTVALELRGTALDGSELRQILGSQNVTRPSTSVEFPEAVFHWTAPLGLKDGTARVIATATDSVNNTGTGESALAILLDQTAPQLVSFTPAAETHYKFNDTYTIEAQVNDAETGIARVVFTVAGVTVLDTTTGGPTFRKTITVPPKNADTRVPIVVTAYDQRGNTVTDTHEVIYERVDDATLPRAAWVTPLDGAALPSNLAGWQTTLRVQATDDVKVTSVRFESTALAAPIELTSPKNGTTDIYEARATLNFPATAFTITAIVNDGDPSHAVELPITIEPVVANPVITGDINITSLTADQYANRSVVARGNVRVYITVPLTLQDLMLVDGATLGVSEETKLDLNVTGRLFVDGDSRIDVSGKGYLGGLRTREDNSFTNTSRAGRTLTGTGAANADASHAGIGGSHLGATNATYGSIENPSDFGAGGGAHPTTAQAGGNGGGALALHGDRLVLAGLVRADGESLYTGGAGGSVLLDAHAVITGPLTRITANGGDGAAAADQDRGGGGGRIAVRATDRLDLDPTLPILQARGGRNGASNGAQFVDGGAGTIVVNRTLTVASIDEHGHRSAGTPLAGTLDFDAIHIGPRALARFDVDIPANVTADATAMILSPADVPSISLVSTSTTNVPQFTPITATVNASSASGIREVRTILSAQPNDTVAYPHWTATLPDTPQSILVPDTATPGAATLKVRVTDRAGRTAETAPVAITIVANTAPVIDTFDVTPATETYAGHDLAVTASATDDVAVTSLQLTSTAGTVTTNAPGNFIVAIPPTTPGNTNVILTLAASDGFPNRASTTATRTIAVKKDTLPPSATIVAPLANQQFNEGAGATFLVDVVASDAEVAVQHVTATLDGIDTELVFAAGHWTKTLAVPNVDGVDPVVKTLTIKAFDFDGNVDPQQVTFSVKPLIDPNAPSLRWACASPGALYPPGYEITLRVSAVPTSQANGVSGVTMSFANGAPIAAARVGSTDSYEAKYTIPPGTADGTIVDVKVMALSVGGNESTLTGTLTAINGVSINTSSTITASDTGFENQSVIVNNGAVLTVIGPHQLRNVAVLSGGKLVQQSVDPLSADAFRVERLFIACGGIADANGAGIAANATFPAAGAPDSSSGGSHIGRGSLYYHASGGTFGSVLEPTQPGGGGHIPTTTPPAGSALGGGAIRIHANSSVAIDGNVRANGTSSGNGAGAGGSVWITSGGVFAGGGAVEAMGAFGGFGGGGGGAIALESASFSDNLTLDARGGTASADGSRLAAAGTVFRRVTGTNGDLVVDNKGIAISATSATELPAFGRAAVASINASTVTLAERRLLSRGLVGHRVRAYASDGGVRGTFRIAAIANSAATLARWTLVPTTDSADYDGWLVYSPTPLGGRNFVAARRNGAQWEYDNDSAFVPFTPAAGQLVFASFRKSANRFTAMEPIRCGASCGALNGIQLAELVAGDLIPDTAPNVDEGLSGFDAGEVMLRGDAQGRAFAIASAAPVVTLEKLSGSDVQSGDRLRGVYVFDNIKLAGARVVSEDLVESLQPVVKDGPSSLVSGNPSAPVIDLARVTIQRGLTGPVVVGTAGAIIDPNAPLEVVARNASLTMPDPPVLRGDDFVGYATAGGFSVRHVDNARNGGSAGTLRRLDGDGWLAFSPSQSTTNVQLSLSPNDTTGAYDEPGHNGFRLTSSGTYEVWANAINANKNGSYTASTAFRIEKSGTALRWYVDNTLVHEIANAPASLLFDISFAQASSGEAGSIELGTSLPPAALHASVASDGSFRVPVYGASGDSIRLSARDRHAYSLQSDELSIGTIPSDFGVASIAFNPTDVTGGRTSIATVTLPAPAGPQGALVQLRSDNVVANVPSSMTIAANATSGTFTVTTTAVLAPVDVTITASYGGSGTSAVLHVVKDNLAPVVTVNAPAPNTAYTEGQAAKIDVRATVSDADSGVKRAWVVFDGTSYELALAGGVWSVLIPVPFVDGSADVTKEIVVNAEDNSGNVGAAAPVPVVIKPVVDNQSPTIAWRCGSAGGVYPVAYAIPLRVFAKAPNGTNTLQKVELTITDPLGNATTLNAALFATDVYQALFTVPDVADGSAFTVHAVATTVGGTTASADSLFVAVKNASEIMSNLTIAANDTTYDNKSVVVHEGFTVTIDGAHTFTRLSVLGTVTHSTGAKLDVTAGETFIGCNGAIDASGKGYVNAATYPGESGAGDATGGSHIGRGGLYGLPYGSTYGSVVRPMEAGAASGTVPSGPGGGVVRINATSVAVDGAIRVNGAQSDRSGAGGSIWISTQRITGTGTIESNGGRAYYGTGAGGAVSIEYTDAASIVPSLSAKTGATYGESRFGGAGSVYVKGPSSTFGDLTLDNGGVNKEPTILPSLGKGIAQAGTSGSTLVTDRAANIPAYFIGHWIEVRDASGVLKGTWRIATINARTVTFAEAVTLNAGDQWQGVYRFDNVRANGVQLQSADTIRVSGTQIIEGTVETSSVTAGTLIVRGALTSPANDMLVINADDVRIETGASIDVTGKGYANRTTYPGETAAGDATGGSHIGRGGLYNGPYGSTYGSVYRPMEAGASNGGTPPGPGGGVVRIVANNVVVDGAVRANGQQLDRSGAGGSVWITTKKITGSGVVEANGGRAYYGNGGGGAVSIEYTDASSTLPSLFAKSGTTYGESRFGGAGSVYVKGPSSTYGDLTVDNGNVFKEPTILPSLGSGIAQSGTSGSTLVTDRATNIPVYFVGHWIEVRDASGTLKATSRIAAINQRTVTLTDALTLNAGDRWQGVYRFDNVHVSGVPLQSADPIRVSGTQTLDGTVETSAIDATSLVVNGTLTHAAGESLTINATDLRVAATGAIDATGKGYANHATYPGEQPAGDATGGSHIGRGGLYLAPYGSTYGSVYRPMEAGASNGGTPPGPGGGVIRIVALNVIVDGAIRANGQQIDRSGAGGSVWITAQKITGSGVIEASGGRAYYGNGGGGAIAIEYSDPASTLPSTLARTGTSYGESRFGGAGSVYVKGPSSTYGDLTIDSGNVFKEATILPSLGNGFAQAGTSGSTLVTDRATTIPPYFVGHWVEVRDPSGVLKATSRIASINNKTVTFADVLSLSAGDQWQGVYRFDNVRVSGVPLQSADPIRVTGTETVEGTVETSVLYAGSLVVKGTLTHAAGASLTINATDVRVDAGAAIDASGRGYANAATYPGESGAGDATGGSHIGRGGLYGLPYGTTYGSVYRPLEPGAASGTVPSGPGGGVVHINATGVVVVNGAIRANGAQSDRSGAGGSVWITASRVTGTGSIEANGGRGYYGLGAGGAVSIEYSDPDPSITLPPLSAKSGTSYGENRFGGAGSVYVRTPSSTYGDLTVDNGGMNKEATILPSLGNGIAQNGTTGSVLVTDRATNIPAYFLGHWVEVRDSGGALKGTWRIAAINAKTITFAESLSLVAGDQWRGVYRFDTVKLVTSTLMSTDPLSYTTLIKDASSTISNAATAPQPSVASTGITLELAPSTITGGARAVATIVLDAPASNIRLTSTNAAAPVPPSVVVPEAATRVQFFIDTLPVTSTQTAVITANDATATLTIVPAVNALASIALDALSVESGESVTATVTLADEAPAGGALVLLATSDASVASVPAAVVVPAGATSTSFPIATLRAGNATITATCNATRVITLAVTERHAP